VEFLFNLAPQEGARYILKNFGVKLVFVTCGAQGCFVANEQAEGFAPSLTDIKVVDTTGAGDIFGGSAVFKLLQTGKAPETLTKEELLEITSFACTSAGLSTTKAGGISSVAEYAEIIGKLPG
jgi:fructokinase